MRRPNSRDREHQDQPGKIMFNATHRAHKSILLLISAGVWIGCQNESRQASGQSGLQSDGEFTGSAVAVPPPPPAAPPMPERGAAGGSLTREESQARAQTQLRAPTDTSAVPGMIIRNGSASVLVDSLEPAVLRVKQMAARLGGYVANTHVQTGESQVRSATLELKIPSARYEQAVSGLDPIGKVEFVNSSAEDVGEEFTDVTARVSNARRLEQRLIELLATRTGKLEDVLAVERELARVREEIERYEGRLRFLRSRVALSTLSVTVHEKAPILSATPGDNIIGAAFVQAWRNFVHFIAGIIALLGWLIPVVALVGLGWWGARRTGLIARWRRPTSLGDDAGPPPV
jgi:hypothetical protein